MPPSGFSRESVNSAVEFIRGCFDDLLAEVSSGKHTSLAAGLQFEVAQIERALTQSNNNVIRGSLLMVQQVYASSLSILETGASDNAAIEQSLDQLAHQLIRIHIDPQGNLVEREPPLPA